MSPKIAIESNSLSFLISAMWSDTCPVNHTSSEEMALLRCYLYLPDTFYFPRTAREECSKIADTDLLKCHIDVDQGLLEELPPPKDKSQFDKLAHFYSQWHHGDKNYPDCKILAECELGNIDILLSYDKSFVKRLM